MSGISEEPAAAHKPLTRREAQVLSFVVDGATNAQIAHGFGLSAETIAIYVSSIREKWNVANRTELAAYALREGLVDGSEGVYPSAIEVEWGQGDEVENLWFRYLAAEGVRRVPETQRAVLNRSFAEYQGPDWKSSISPMIVAVQGARHTDSAVPFFGSLSHLEETSGDYAWAGSISQISDTHYLVVTESFPGSE